MSGLIDHGEPWGHKTDPETGDNILVDSKGNEIGLIYEASVWHRIKAESEALAGCPDPKAFVEAVKEIKAARDRYCEGCDDSNKPEDVEKPNFGGALKQHSFEDGTISCRYPKELSEALNDESLSWLKAKS